MAIEEWAPLIEEASFKYQIRRDLLRADILHESNGDPLAIGDGGLALGLMQVHPSAAKDVGGDWGALKTLINAKNRESAAEMGITIGAEYLAKMLTLFRGNERLALMAFNQGPGVIGKADSYASAVLALAPNPDS